MHSTEIAGSKVFSKWMQNIFEINGWTITKFREINLRVCNLAVIKTQL